MSGKWKRAALALVLVLGLSLAGCQKGSSGPAGGGIKRPETIESAELQFTHPVSGDTVAVFDTSAGVFRAVLFPEEAPQACANFVGLVQAGYYNGLTVTRVESGFVVEAGQDAAGGSTTIWNGNGYPPDCTDKLHHYSGALCAAMTDAREAGRVLSVVRTAPCLEQERPDQVTAQGWRPGTVPA